MSYQAFRKIVAKIDAALNAIESAKKIPDNLAYEQRRITAYSDSNGYREVSPDAKKRANQALKLAVEDARREGERQRDEIIAREQSSIESMRSALGSMCGAAVIDLGHMARAATMQEAAE